MGRESKLTTIEFALRTSTKNLQPEERLKWAKTDLKFMFYKCGRREEKFIG